MAHTTKYYGTLSFLALLCLALPIIVLPEVGVPLVPTTLIVFLAGACIYFAADKKIDNSWRGTVAINENKSV